MTEPQQPAGCFFKSAIFAFILLFCLAFWFWALSMI